MTRPDEHIFQHPKTHVFWFRRVIPPRLRPHMPDVPDLGIPVGAPAGRPLFPARPTRIQFVRTLATKDRRRANAAALPIKHAVNHAFAEAERRFKATGTVRLPATPDGRSTDPVVVPIRREAALAAIERWRTQSIEEAELRHFNTPPLDRQAAYKAAEAEAPLMSALAEASGQVGTGAPWPAHGDARLAAALSGQGLPVGADHPALPRLRRAFAEAWLQVLRAENEMRWGSFLGEAPPEAPTVAPPPPLHGPWPVGPWATRRSWPTWTGGGRSLA